MNDQIEMPRSLLMSLRELGTDTAAFAIMSVVAARQVVRAATRVAYGIAADAAAWAQKYSKDGDR